MNLSWITGAAGFIGRHLVRHLIDSDTPVAALDLAPFDFPGLLDYHNGAVSFESLSALADSCGLPSTVYHLAGGSSVGASISNPYADFSGTVSGTGALLEWLRKYAPETRVVLVSSAAVYGNLHSEPIDDDASTTPYSPYGAHKLAMEVVCRGWADSFGLQILAARLFSVYGPNLRKQLLWDLSGRLCSSSNKVLVGGTGAELRDWTHVGDVVRALCTLAPYASSNMPVVNVGTGIGTSVRTIAENLAREYGRDAGCLSYTGENRKGDPQSLVAADGKLKGVGFEWRMSLKDGIAEYANWYMSQDQE